MKAMTDEPKYPLSDFMDSTRPAQRQSKLLGYREDIRIARANKYTLAQICQWLKKNGVEVSIKGLSKFIKTQERRELAKKSVAASVTRETPPASNTGKSHATPKLGARRGLHEPTAAEFIKTDNNSVLDILNGNNP